MDIDAATAAAVKTTKKEKEAAASHRRQLSRNTARKRANLQVVEARKSANIEAAQARAASVERGQAAKTAATRDAIAARSQAQSQQRGDIRRERFVGGAVSKTTSTLTPSSDSNLLMTTLFLIVGLAVVYQLVTGVGPSSTSTWINSVGNLLHKISSTVPLFQVKSSN